MTSIFVWLKIVLFICGHISFIFVRAYDITSLLFSLKFSSQSKKNRRMEYLVQWKATTKRILAGRRKHHCGSSRKRLRLTWTPYRRGRRGLACGLVPSLNSKMGMLVASTKARQVWHMGWGVAASVRCRISEGARNNSGCKSVRGWRVQHLASMWRMGVRALVTRRTSAGHADVRCIGYGAQRACVALRRTSIGRCSARHAWWPSFGQWARWHETKPRAAKWA